MPDAASARCASERDSSSDASFDFSPRSRSQCAFLPPCRNNVYRSAPPGGAPSTAPAQRASTSRRGGGGGGCGSQTSQRRAAVPRLFAASGRQTTSAASLGQGEAGREAAGRGWPGARRRGGNGRIRARGAAGKGNGWRENANRPNMGGGDGRAWRIRSRRYQPLLRPSNMSPPRPPPPFHLTPRHHTPRPRRPRSRPPRRPRPP